MAGLGCAEEALLEFSLAGSRDVAWLPDGISLWQFCCSDTFRTSGYFMLVFLFVPVSKALSVPHI